MKNVRLFPVKYIPITETAKETLIELQDYFDTEIEYPCCLLILSFVQLYNPTSIPKILAGTLLNKKLNLAEEYSEWGLYDWKDIKSHLKHNAAGVAWEIFLKENTKDKELLKYYREIEEQFDPYFTSPSFVYSALYNKVLEFYPLFDFFGFGIYYIIWTLFDNGLLDNIKGVKQWVRKNAAYYKAQLMNAKPFKLFPPQITKPQDGGQETLPNTKKK